MSRVRRFVEKLRESGLTGKILAAILVMSIRYHIWPAYLWLLNAWMGLGWPPIYTWGITALYFAFWTWLYVLLIREGKRYHGMTLDAIFGGSLFAVAAALHDPSTRQIGFGAATWIVFLCGFGLVVGKAIRPNERVEEQHAEPRSEEENITSLRLER